MAEQRAKPISRQPFRKYRLDPAHKIVRRLGGARVVAEEVDRAYTAPYRWAMPRNVGGTGGIIPMRHHPALMRLARRRGVKLKLSDFYPL